MFPGYFASKIVIIMCSFINRLTDKLKQQQDAILAFVHSNSKVIALRHSNSTLFSVLITSILCLRSPGSISSWFLAVASPQRNAMVVKPEDIQCFTSSFLVCKHIPEKYGIHYTYKCFDFAFMHIIMYVSLSDMISSAFSTLSK